MSELAACDDSGTLDAGAWNCAQSSILLRLAKLDDTWQVVRWNLAPATGNVCGCGMVIPSNLFHA